MPVHLPSVLAVERMEIPARLVRIDGYVRKVITVIAGLDGDGPVRFEIIGAEKESLAGGKENVPVLQDNTERDVLSLGKRRAVMPRPAVVLRQINLPAAEPEGFFAALRVDVRPRGCQPIPKMLCFTQIRLRGSESAGAYQQRANRYYRALEQLPSGELRSVFHFIFKTSILSTLIELAGNV